MREILIKSKISQSIIIIQLMALIFHTALYTYVSILFIVSQWCFQAYVFFVKMYSFDYMVLLDGLFSEKGVAVVRF